MTQQEKYHAPSLDALRLVASLAIVVGHLVPTGLLPIGLENLFHGGVSTTLFFVMSGFVLSTSNRFWQQSWREIAVKRIGRLYSLHLIFFIALLPFAIFGSQRISKHELLRVLGWWGTGMQGLLPFGSFEQLWNFPAWVVTPLLIGGLSLPWLKLAKLRKWPLESSFGLLFVVVGIRLAFDLLQDGPASDFESTKRHMAFLPRLLEINAGALSGVIFWQLGTRFNLIWLGRDATLALLLLLLEGSLIYIESWYGAPGLFTFTHGPVLPILLVCVASAYMNQGRIAALCRRKWIAKGAQISILVWILHIPLTRYWQYAAARTGIGAEFMGSFLGFGLNLILVLIAALILDRPMQKLEQSLTRAMLRWTSLGAPQIPSVN